VIDTAQGDSDFAFRTLAQIKQEFPSLDVVVGNISNADSARELAAAGADGIKVGQGPGSICTTRIETGIGSPQVTAVYDCAEAVKNQGVPICADGGINNPGDISIAIAAGASSVMMGGRLAGTKETPGEVTVNEAGQMVKLYRGMGSPSAMKDSAASRKRYGVEGSKGLPLSEGVESYVIYKGSVIDMLDHYIKALRKSMSYVGSDDIQTHRTATRFHRITNAGYRESLPRV
jgi:IMP dehydrogenase